MRACHPGRSRRLIEPGNPSLAQRGRRERRSGRAALRRTGRLIPEASDSIVTADDDDAVLAALVRSLGSHSAGSGEDVGDVALVGPPLPSPSGFGMTSPGSPGP